MNFKIDQKKFFVTDLTRAKSFEVKSIPKSYTLTWDDSEKPYNIINHILRDNSNNLLLIDEVIYNLYGKFLEVTDDKIFIAKATEDFKTLNGVVNVIDFLQKNKLTKGEKLIVVGGGIIQDVGAFVGACYKRGIPWILMPTTLLSMCDSCIGGKTGINHNNAKNQLALFSAPYEVIINPNYLTTLEQKEIRSGLGEILKLHITGGKHFLSRYKKLLHEGKVVDSNAYKQLILDALSVKKAIIEEDEFELNYRKSLNYGHTVGHAIEVLSNYKIPHGQAVVIGMIVVNELSNRKFMLADTEKKQLEKILFELLDPEILQTMKKISLERLGELLKKDKKTTGNFVNFVVIESIGEMSFLSQELDSAMLTQVSDIIKEVFGTS